MLRNWFFSRVMQPFLRAILYLNYLPQLQSGIKLPVTDRFSWFFRICPCHAKPTTGRILLRLDLNCVICKAITVFHVDIPFTKNFVPISIRIGKLRVLHVWNLSCKFHWYQKKNSFTFRHSQLIDIENCLLRIPGLVEFLSSNHPYMLITCICRRNKNLGNASWLHTPVVGNSLNTAHTCRLHKTYSGQKSKEHPDVLIAYTCGRQKSKEQTYMLITYTCGGQKSNGCAYMQVTYTCGGQKSNGCA